MTEFASGVVTPSLAPEWGGEASLWVPPVGVYSAWEQHAPFAMWLTSVLEPRVVVELGTHRGFSFFVFCEAVKRLGLDARVDAVDTWTGDEHAGFYGDEIYQAVEQTRADYGYDSFSRLLKMTFEEALAEVPDGSVDLLHIDGRHRYEDVKTDAEQWFPKLSERAVVLFHDTAERQDDFGVWQYWAELSPQRPSFQFLHDHGLGVLGYGEQLAPRVREFFEAANRDPEAVRSAYETLGARVSAARDADRRFEEYKAYSDQLVERVHELEARSAHEQARSEEAETVARRLRDQNALLASQLAELEEEWDRARSEIEALRSSTSWRLTAPVRLVSGLLRGRR